MPEDARWQEAITYAQSHEVPWPRDPAADPAAWGVHHADPPPWNRLRGPVHPRGGVSGVIRHNGHEVAAWGEPDRADQTFSVAKTALALLAGLAQGRGLLPDVDEPVSRRLPGIGFDEAHNRTITWAHLLTQTSEWQGECLGMPDQVEHYRPVAHDPKPPQGRKGDLRPLQAPGTYWEYNDVRINQLALALLHLWHEPLTDVFQREILAPLGGGEGFAWEPYDDGWVHVRGRRLPTVPGGTHWGGGMRVGARDLSRLGQLLLDEGRHEGRALLPAAWVRRMGTPVDVAPFYGGLLWLNTGGGLFADASPESVFMIGAGGHYVWIDPAHAAVVVVRWLDPARSPGFVTRVARALAG